MTTTDREASHYEILELEDFADAEAVKQSYRDLSRRYHPDSPLTPDEDKFKAINKANTALSNPNTKEKYDKELARDKLKAEAQRRAREAREQRQPTVAEANEFSDRLGGQTISTAHSTISRTSPFSTTTTGRPSARSNPRPQPSPASSRPPRAPSPSRQPVTPAQPATSPPPVGRVGEVLSRLGLLVAALAFLAAPFGIMYFVAPASNAHPNIFLDLVSIGCFFWFVAGVFAVFTALGALFD
jgi:curved DNA-binding protein CbpA